MSDAKVFTEIAMRTKLFSMLKPDQVLFDVNDNDSYLSVK
jgi:hypothetical protein